jgi:hypothetical protein
MYISDVIPRGATDCDKRRRFRHCHIIPDDVLEQYLMTYIKFQHDAHCEWTAPNATLV